MKLKLDTSSNTNIFVTSDSHYFHNACIKQEFDNRPFKKEDGSPDVELMNETLIENWNSVVKKNDIVFFLGDFAMCNWKDAKIIAHRLNGRIHFVLGNHDVEKDIKKLDRFETISDYIELSLTEGDEKHHIMMFHYPALSWNRKKYGSYFFHGHRHHNHHEDNSFMDNFYKENKTLDVGVNGHGYFPLNIKEAISIINNRQKK